MSRSPLTGAGLVQMKVLEEALGHLGLLHSIVEQMALALKTQQPLQPFGPRLRRAAVPVTDLLKGQFGLIADQVTHLTLVATRGGNERMKVTSLREGVASIRTAIELAQRKVAEKYAEEEAGDEAGNGE